MRSWWVVAVMVLGLAPVGCGGSKRGPVAASSAAEAGYAVRFPDELEAMVARFDDRQRETRRLSQGFAAYADQVKDVKKDLVIGVVDRADQAGRSQSYAEAQHEAARVQTFFREEKDELNKKVGGSIQFAAKQKGCPFDAYGATSHALGEGIDKQLEERLRKHNEAQAFIERHRVSLKAQAATLEKQADEISLASYIAHVESVELRDEIARRADEGAAVQGTADSFMQQEQAFQAEPGRTADEKKASDQRIQAMARSKGRVEASVQRAKQSVSQMDQNIKESQRAYADGLAALRAKLK